MKKEEILSCIYEDILLEQNKRDQNKLEVLRIIYTPHKTEKRRDNDDSFYTVQKESQPRDFSLQTSPLSLYGKWKSHSIETRRTHRRIVPSSAFLQSIGLPYSNRESIRNAATIQICSDSRRVMMRTANEGRLSQSHSKFEEDKGTRTFMTTNTRSQIQGICGDVSGQRPPLPYERDPFGITGDKKTLMKR